MGIHDRDYMRRRPEEEEDRRGDNSTGSWLASKLSHFFERYPRFGVWLAAVLGLAILIVLILARLAFG
jgi:hypothetical protein